MRTVAAIASLVDLVTPLFDDRFPSHAALNLFRYVRDQDACAAKCRFAMAGSATMYRPNVFVSIVTVSIVFHLI